MKNIRKFLAVFLIAATGLFLVGCNKKEFKQDGVFTAYTAEGTNVTTVSVTIEKGKIEGFYIDVLQGKVIKGEDGKAALVWNEKTKKELKYDYRMHGNREMSEEEYKAFLKEENKLEWFEQAELIEKAWLKDGFEKHKANDDGKFDSIAGVSIKVNDYVNTAKKALDLAKAGKVQAVSIDGGNITTVQVTTKKGKVNSYYIDVLQGKASLNADDDTKGTLKWNEKSKKELKFDYGMKGNGPKYELKDGEWVVVENAKSEKEWFEQAELIEKHWLKNGVEKPSITDGRFDSIAGVTIKDAYTATAKKALAQVK